MTRILAFVAAVLVPVAAAFEALLLGALPWWTFAAVAAAFALPVVVTRPKMWTTAAIGAVLAAFSAYNAQAGASLLPRGEAPVVDLTRGDALGPNDGIVNLRGYLRDEWVLDEYRVEAGERPDQNDKAPAVLMPMLPTADEPLVLDGEGMVVVVVRMRGDAPRPDDAITIRGMAHPLSEALAQSLLAQQPREIAQAVEGVLVDAIDVPDPTQGFTLLAIAGVCALVALWMMLSAARGPPRREPKA